jgi:gas vesicle protein
MAFKGLEDRFKAKAQSLYTVKEERTPEQQPYVQVRPDAEDTNALTHDTRMQPVGSVRRDVTRIGAFLKSQNGKLFLTKQKTLQTGNVFAETRTVNGNFITDNLSPFNHAPRVGNSAGNNAGRLQIATTKDAIARAAQDGPKSLLALVPQSSLADMVLGRTSLKGAEGIAPVDGRPELTISGEYYSVLMWKRFEKLQTISPTLTTAMSQIRKGNVKGAENVLRRSADNFLGNIRRTVTSRIGIDAVTSKLAPLSRGYDADGIEGRRYFITSRDGADRYMKNSVTQAVNIENRVVAESNVSYLDRRSYGGRITGNVNRPYAFVESKLLAKAVQKIEEKFGPKVSRISGKLTDKLKSSKIAVKIKDIQKDIKSAVPAIHNKLPSFAKDLVKEIAQEAKDYASTGEENPAEQNMMFNRLSIRQRFEKDERAIELQNELKKFVTEKETSYWKPIRDKNIGFFGGLKPGISPEIKTTKEGISRIGDKSSMTDRMNSLGVIDNAGDASVSAEVEKSIGDVANDMIDVLFYDVVNKRAVPFRAFITAISERVQPTYEEVPYIGRSERNVVYVRSKREVSFTLQVYAFAEAELTNVWDKINYVTGLCYPSAYDVENGFMTPPVMKLTIGNLYRNQPGYITSLTNQIEDGVSWETTDGFQVPRGISMQVQFSILEKSQMHTGRGFYSITEPRN